MRESFVLIILSLVIAVRCLNSESDSYNIYKDHMRAHPTGINPVIKTILESYVSSDEYKMPTWLPEYIERASDVLKKSMLNKLAKLDRRLDKRTSKAALSLMLQSKQNPDHTEEEHSCYSGK